MHRPRRIRRSRDVEEAGGTNFSNPRERQVAMEKKKRQRTVAAGAVGLFVAVGLIGYHAITNFVPSGTEIKSFAVGHPAFQSESKTSVPTAHATVEMMRHEKTGMEIMTVVPDDSTQDATFGISFRTPVDDNRGIATIVEHAVQAGSKKYRAKDPIRMVQAGSLATHWESWTEKDRSSFVYSSRNLQDFKNSMSVIVDGVFHSVLAEPNHEWIYRQEGWRLEAEGIEQKLSLSGNAYNRAKAAQMFPQEALEHFVYKALFEGHTYGYEPKGLWNDILSGIRGHMINFYKKWYQPKNAKAFCYGRGDYINECLDILDQAISNFEEPKEDDFSVNLPDDSKIQFRKLDDITGNIQQRQAYPSFQTEKDYRVGISWVLNDSTMDSRTEVAWFLIKELLVGSHTAIIPKAVLKYGDDFIGHLDSDLQQWVLTMGVTGLEKEGDGHKAEEDIYHALKLISQNGFDKAALKPAMNIVEFRLRDLNSRCGMPQGANMFKKVLSKWNYDLDPRLALSWYTEFVQLKAELEDPDNTESKEFLLELVTKYLLDNSAKSSVVLYPSTSMQTDARRSEIEWLQTSDDYWDKETGFQIMAETSQLHKLQREGDSPTDLQFIPRLKISDIEDEPFDEMETVVKDDIFNSGVTMIENEVPDSNGIGYIDFAIDISLLKFEDIILVPLLCRLMAEAGTDRKTDVDMQYHIDTFTGGLSIEPLVEEIHEFKDTNNKGYLVDSGKHMRTMIVIRSSCFADKGCTELFNIVNTVLFDSKIANQEKAINILQDMIDDLEDDIQRHGHDYATRRIESRYALPGYIREQWHGVTQLFKARNALEEAKTNWNGLSNRLLQMQDAVKRVHHSGMLLSITGDKKTIKDLSGAVSVFFQDFLPASAMREPLEDFSKVEHPWVKTGNEAMDDDLKNESPFSSYIVPTLVNDVSNGGLLYDVGQHISGAHIASAHYVSGFYLNDKIRFNLGAHQAWARLDLDSGVIVYQSEGTPDIEPTIEVFKEAGAWVQGQMSGTDFLPIEAEAAIVAAIGQMDGSRLQPNKVGYVAMLRYLKKDNKAARRKWRTEALSATKDDFLALVSMIGGWENPSICAVTNQKLLDKANTKLTQNMTACAITGYACP